MPLYDFYCKSCNKTFELLAKVSSTPACPECGGEIEKQVSRIAPAGKTAGIVARARAQASKEGHFSNYSKAEKKGL
ncbi:MAG TPA: FmdB family transcriptional regulator [Methylophilaceae bacterium]|nr:FmdB family transcriptional regulator [Methylophilaceae bacterium]HAJ72773.1 FmdB family transcriptional regulator [Methylophilaceae bacterium]